MSRAEMLSNREGILPSWVYQTSISPSRLWIIPIKSIPLGALKSDETSQYSLDIEDFLAGFRFEQMGKLDELPFTW